MKIVVDKPGINPSTEEGLTEVKTYRQTLRDITTQETFPDSVTWPDTPAVLLKQPEKAMVLSEDE